MQVSTDTSVEFDRGGSTREGSLRRSRDSKDPAGPTLAFDPTAWARFLAMAKRG
ncbi:DUF397 domain-containing protein [Micromonospora zamorensis]|uniref:DUF397 domain-containing protein n=1 Tax=Micromonospora zamorensis TaxID=709883 RepID=UPI0037206761